MTDTTDIRITLNPESEKWGRYTLLDMKERIMQHAERLSTAWEGTAEKKTPDERVRLLRMRLRKINEILAMNSLWLDEIKKAGKNKTGPLKSCLRVARQYDEFLEGLDPDAEETPDARRVRFCKNHVLVFESDDDRTAVDVPDEDDSDDEDPIDDDGDVPDVNEDREEDDDQDEERDDEDEERDDEEQDGGERDCRKVTGTHSVSSRIPGAGGTRVSGPGLGNDQVGVPNQAGGGTWTIPARKPILRSPRLQPRPQRFNGESVPRMRRSAGRARKSSTKRRARASPKRKRASRPRTTRK